MDYLEMIEDSNSAASAMEPPVETPKADDTQAVGSAETPSRRITWRFLLASARRAAGCDDISAQADHWFSYAAISPLDEGPPAVVPNTHPVLTALAPLTFIEDGGPHYETKCPICGSIVLLREYSCRLVISCWGKPPCTFCSITTKLGFTLTDWILDPAGVAEFYNDFADNNAEFLDDGPSEPLRKRDPKTKF